MFRVSRPIELVVLNCCVTDTKLTWWREELHDAGEVQYRPAETVDLVDHHAVDLSGLDVRAQALKGGPVHVAAGESAVVKAVG